MPTIFKNKIRIALKNPVLQAALDYNSERRKSAYSQAFQELPRSDYHKEQARLARQRVIDDLDAYLDQFIQQATANGIKVLRAANGIEAVKLVKEIATRRSARLLVKSKTMVSEEIDLNHALEADGLEVVETDLGEYIVQLRGERPGHILTPAVHLRRSEVGQTFAEKLGVPYTEDVVTLTQVARRMLRQKFLTADIGISGVNFGVAENGLLCVLTNEGNGRMCTTVPPVHIALMGMERLVANMDDLAKVLKVLPRASTGQKITVYTNLIRGPRQENEADGPEERYLIILDNGRENLRKGPYSEALNCIRCGACLNVCPVFREIGGHAYVGEAGQVSVYSGPIGSVIAPGLFGVENFGNLARASSLCGACKDACPVGIDLPGLLLQVRAEQAVQQKPISSSKVPGISAFSLKVYSRIASSARWYHTAQKLAGFLGGFLGNSKGWIHMPAFTGWGYAKDFPRPAQKSFREMFENREKTTQQQNGTILNPQAGKDFSKEQPVEIEINEDLISRFQIELEALGGEFIECSSGNLDQKIIEEIQKEGCSRIWAWEAGNLPKNLLDKIGEHEIEVVTAYESVQEMALIKIGLTGCASAVAETGSVALSGGMGQPLLASLLPEIHFAVVYEEQLVQSIEELFKLPGLFDRSAAALVSGPSRTGDIELTLTIGVHGPKRVVVFCVTD